MPQQTTEVGDVQMDDRGGSPNGVHLLTEGTTVDRYYKQGFKSLNKRRGVRDVDAVLYGCTEDFNLRQDTFVKYIYISLERPRTLRSTCSGVA